jgi:DNA repair photolyase
MIDPSTRAHICNSPGIQARIDAEEGRGALERQASAVNTSRAEDLTMRRKTMRRTKSRAKAKRTWVEAHYRTLRNGKRKWIDSHYRKAMKAHG